MTQLVQFNTSVVGKIGWCLWYVEEGFGTAHIYDTAWEAWENTKDKHFDQNFPTGVSFCAFFSGADGAGHVVAVTPNGIYSSPYNTQIGHNVLSSIAEVEQKYGVKYVGYSLDLAGVQLVKEEDMFNEGDAINFNNYFYGKDNGRFRDQIGREWKTASYNIQEQLKEEKQLLVNSGDVTNLAGVGITNADQANGKNWKDAVYSVILPNLPKNSSAVSLDPTTANQISQTSTDVSWIRSLLNKIFK
jgi:hypothetical protein